MERLTEYDYLAGVKTGDIKIGVDERKAFDKLAHYEDTGLTPEEIVSLNQQLAAVTAERDAALADMKKIAKKSQQSNCDFCNKKKCIGCHVEDNFEWRGKVEE